MRAVWLIAVILILSAVIYLYEEKHGKSKHCLSTIVLFILIFLLLAGNYQNADTHNYEIEYNENVTGYGLSLTGYWGYYALNVLCNALNMNYYHSRFIVYGLCLLLLLLAINRINVNRYAVLVLYMFFPMVIDATQTRNFAAMSLVTLAITFLISDKIRDRILFVVLIMLASGFHPVCYVFIPLAVCDSKKIDALFVVPVVLFSLIFANGKMASILSDFILAHLNGFLALRAGAFFKSRVGGYWVRFLATGIINIYVYYMRKTILARSDSTDKEKRFSNIAMYCSLYSLAFLPLYFFTADFGRLFRIFFPTFHMLFIMFLEAGKSTSVSQGEKALLLKPAPMKLLLIIGYSLLIVYMFYWDIYVFKDTVVKPFFRYNSIFDFLYG